MASTVSPRSGVALPDRSAVPNMVSYHEARSNHNIEVPDRFNPVLHIVESWATEEPEDQALVSHDAQRGEILVHTSADLARESRRAARALEALGIGKGDRVFVMLPRCAEWYFVLLGAMRLGAIPMPGPNLLTPKDIAYRVSRSGAAAVVTGDSGADKVEAITDGLPGLRVRIRCQAAGEPERTGWHDLGRVMDEAGDGATPLDPTSKDDPLLIYFTSGTVGPPKMVEHVQSYGLGHVGTARYWHDLRRGDRHWTVTDTGWAKAAWGGLFGQWHERATVVQVDLASPDPDKILSIIDELKVTSFCAPPTLYRQLIRVDFGAHDLSTLRHCTSAGEPLNPEVIRAWSEGTGGLMIYDGYGQTETTALVANYRSVDVRPGSMGKPVPGYDVTIRDDAGEEVPDGQLGNIAVATQPHPVGLFKGYLEDPRATASRFRDNYYYTGDRASRDVDGYFWFEGREDDVITSSAYRIGPFEVESALIEHAAVVEAAVVGKPDPERTELVCAFVVLAPGYEPSDKLTSDIQAHVKEVTAPYKYPRAIHYVVELPKTISGKIRRTELRGWLRTAIPPGTEVPVASDGGG